MKAKTDPAPILDLYKQGLSAAKIVERLGLQISARQVMRIVKDNGLSVARVTVGRHRRDTLVEPLRSLVVQQLAARGDDPYFCVICKEQQDNKCDIHHTKYAGASIADLAYVCRSCNLAGAQMGLA